MRLDFTKKALELRADKRRNFVQAAKKNRERESIKVL
jgi:hypothetical protein